MPNPAWFNDNQFRDFPFLTRVEPLATTAGFSSSSSAAGTIFDLPHSAILDFGAIMEIDANFDESLGHIVYLHSIHRSGSLLTFKFRTNATDAENFELIFHRNVTDREFTIEWEEASTIVAETISEFTCPLHPKWSGFMVSGDLHDLFEMLDDNETAVCIEGLWQIEPARIQSLMRSYLRSISLANEPRIHATPAVGCSDSSSYASNEPAIPNAQCLAGNIQWKEGYNCSIRQDVNNNAIIIGAGVGVGAGPQCEELPLYPGEVAPTGSPFLSGGPACNEIVKAINGVSGDNITITPGPGFQIEADTVNPHKLIVNRTLDEFAVCLHANTSSVSVSSSDSATMVACGVFTSSDIFNVTILAGKLADTTINSEINLECKYEAIESVNGNMTFVSKQVLTAYWVTQNFCGFRWRVKFVCDGLGLSIVLVVYPLADNNPCQTYTAYLGHDFSPPIRESATMTYSKASTGCPCAETDLVTSIQVSQV